ncbi:MAG: twin-arginine translocase subunit TatB, partial [Pseudomonadota bacterium]
NEAADASGASDIAKDLKGLNNPRNFGMDSLKEAADQFDKWEPGKQAKAMGPETAKLAQERAEAARKIQEATRIKEDSKRAAAIAADAAELEAEPEPEPTPAQDTAAEDTKKA